jgi:hypothetical protein
MTVSQRPSHRTAATAACCCLSCLLSLETQRQGHEHGLYILRNKFVEALCYKPRVAGSIPDEVTGFFQFT